MFDRFLYLQKILKCNLQFKILKIGSPKIFKIQMYVDPFRRTYHVLRGHKRWNNFLTKRFWKKSFFYFSYKDQERSKTAQYLVYAQKTQSGLRIQKPVHRVVFHITYQIESDTNSYIVEFYPLPKISTVVFQILPEYLRNALHKNFNKNTLFSELFGFMTTKISPK